MENENLTYSDAMQELEGIVEKVENNEMNIDDLTVNLKRAQILVKFCREKLLKTEEEVNKILSSDDLKSGAVTSPDKEDGATQADTAQDDGDYLPF